MLKPKIGQADTFNLQHLNNLIKNGLGIGPEQTINTKQVSTDILMNRHIGALIEHQTKLYTRFNLMY